MIAVYGIYNHTEEKWYIGSSVNLSRRRSEHLSLLRRGTHPNKKLQDSCNRTGFSSIEFFVIEELDNDSNLLNIEFEYIKEFDSYNNGYNNTDTTLNSSMSYLEIRSKHWGELHGGSAYSNDLIEKVFHILSTTEYPFSKISDITKVGEGTINYIAQGGHQWIHLKYPEDSLKIQNRGSKRTNTGTIYTNDEIYTVFKVLLEKPYCSFQEIEDLTGIPKETISAISSGRQYSELFKKSFPNVAEEYLQLGKLAYTKKYAPNHVFPENDIKSLINYILSKQVMSREDMSRNTGISETLTRKFCELNIDLYKFIVSIVDIEVFFQLLQIRSTKKMTANIQSNYNFLKTYPNASS